MIIYDNKEQYDAKIITCSEFLRAVEKRRSTHYTTYTEESQSAFGEIETNVIDFEKAVAARKRKGHHTLREFLNDNSPDDVV